MYYNKNKMSVITLLMYTGKISVKHEHEKRQQYLFIEHVNSN